MTVKEKRGKLADYCCCTRCDECKLANKNWISGLTDNNCIDIKLADETELDRALAIISEDKTEDPIKPDYYNDTKITPFDVIDDWSLNFYLGNAIKYIKRAGKKANNSRLQDLKKVREYIDHEIQAEEAIE